MSDNYAADILEALGRTDAAANLRWGDKPDDARLRRIASLEASVEELTAELKHANEDMTRLEQRLCPTCKERRYAA